MAVTKAASENLERIKHDVQTSYIYFEDNCRRFRDYRRYVFKESVSEQQKSVLQQLSRPIVEFNILEAYISRLLGEFSQHEPSIDVSPSEGVPVNQDVLDVVEGHLRHILHEANKNSFAYDIYKDLLSGGFSVAKVTTDYASPMSFDQQIYLNRVFDPTLCGFDPMARAPHKGDGRYSFEIYPMTEEDFKRAYPNARTNNMSYVRDMQGFNWSYKDMQNNKIILVVEFYEKKRKRTKIVKLANGRVLTVKNYEKLKKYWDEQGFIEQIPAIIGEPRTTDLEVVCCYRLVEDEVLEYYETDYTYLPHIFFDGHSIILTQGTNNCTYQMTRPYVYHAKGVQDMMNFSGQTMCNSMENLIQHKFIVMKEAIPQEQDYIEALNDIQRANTIVVNAYSENNPDKPIPTPIREVQNVPLPPEVLASFQTTGGVTQTILGSFASNLGKNDNDLSGKAVIESSTVGNAAAMPYVVGYLSGLTQVGNVCVDLMPKYIVGKRTIPVVYKDGRKDYKKVNQDNINLDYEERAIKVNIEAGVNFQVQKNQAVEQIIALTRANETLGKFFTSEKGLKILARNLTIYGADNLEEAIDEFLQQEQAQQQQAMHMQEQAMQRDPRMIKAQADMMKVQSDDRQKSFDNEMKIAQELREKELADAQIVQIMANVNNAGLDGLIKIEEANASRHNHAIDAAAKFAEIKSREHQDHLETHRLIHDIREAKNADTTHQVV